MHDQALQLVPGSLREDDFLAEFRSWQGSQRRFARVGVPDWLATFRPRPTAKQITRNPGFSSSFRPDLEGEADGARLVLELKCAAKGEPIALAEALHHAYMLSILGEGVHVPVVVTQYNNWLRASIQYLFVGGLHREGLRYVEVTPLRRPSPNVEERPAVLWFEEPCADWAPCAPPRGSDQCPTGLHWYKARGAPTWYGAAETFETRPALWQVAYWMISNEDAGSTRQLLWNGSPDGSGHYRWI
jgi:hypothetical protein